MAKAIPNAPRSNSPWTPEQRRAWLAQQRRRATPHLLPGPAIRPVYPLSVGWDWPYADPFRWYGYVSLNSGLTWIYDDYKSGDSRTYSPDGGSSLFRIVGVNAQGVPVTEPSNAVRPDDAPAPPNAPVLIDAAYAWNGGDPDSADITVSFSFDPGSYPDASVEIWMNRNNEGFAYLSTVDSFNGYFNVAHACGTETTFDFEARYVNGTVVGPFSNVLHLDVNAP